MTVSAIDCIKGFNSSSCVLLPREQLQKLYMLLVYSPNHMKAFSKLHLFISIAIDAAPYEPKPSAAGTKPRIGSEDRDNAILGLMQNLSVEGLGPQWISPAPPMLLVLDGEVKFFT